MNIHNLSEPKIRLEAVAGDSLERSTLAQGKRPKYTLDQLLAGMRISDMPIDHSWDVMPLVGREVVVGK